MSSRPGAVTLAVGASGHDLSRGAVHVLELRAALASASPSPSVSPTPSGSPSSVPLGSFLDQMQQEISATEAGLDVQLHPWGLFGTSVASLGDMDGDGIPELAVGAPEHGPSMEGAVIVLFLRSNGTVKSH